MKSIGLLKNEINTKEENYQPNCKVGSKRNPIKSVKKDKEWEKTYIV